MPNIITYDQLVEKSACLEQLLMFKRMFGESVDLSMIEYDHDQHGKFDFHWAAIKLLNKKAYKVYRNSDDIAYQDFRERVEKARTEYWADKISLHKYDDIRERATYKYQAIADKAFIECYLAMEG